MSATIRIRCDGIRGTGIYGDPPCYATIEFETGSLRARGAMLKKKGWTHGRGTANDLVKRPRMDWCPKCSRARARAKKVLGR